MESRTVNDWSQALELLVSGNRRFQKGLFTSFGVESIERRRELAEKGQSPFAIVLTCSDSRIPTEMVFDCGLGELFVIRVAGNVVEPALVASIEFAAQALGTSLCIVMGHSQCGAIKAAYQTCVHGTPVPTDNLGRLVTLMQPAVVIAAAKHEKKGEAEILRHATMQNVFNSIDHIHTSSSAVRELCGKGELAIIGAHYDIRSGEVDFHLDDVRLKKYASHRARR